MLERRKLPRGRVYYGGTIDPVVTNRVLFGCPSVEANIAKCS